MTPFGAAVLILVMWALVLTPTLLAARLYGPLTRRTVVTASVIVAAFLMSVHCWSLDGLDGIVASLVLSGNTEYARDYSALGFSRIRVGMTEVEVLQVVGEPIERYTIEREPGLTGWRWTRTPDSSSYHRRAVLFRDGRVINKMADYYVD